MSNEKKEDKTYGILKSPQESMIELIKKLSESDDRICMFSDYNDKEIQNFALLEAFNGILNSSLLSIFIKRHDMRRVSKMRLGRRELVTVSSNLNPLMPIELGSKSGIGDRIKSLLYRRR